MAVKKKTGRYVKDPKPKRAAPAVVCGALPEGEEFASQCVKLIGTDELIMVHCVRCKCAHYYLAQRIEGMQRFRVFELLQGETIARIAGTQHSGVNAHDAITSLEADADAHPLKRCAPSTKRKKKSK
jgi:hypothetical protein